MEHTQTIDPTDELEHLGLSSKFWSWKKIEAGHYVLTTDTRYTATVRKRPSYGWIGWAAEVTSPSGEVRTQGMRDSLGDDGFLFGSMANARKWALTTIKELMDTDEATVERWNGS